MSDLRCSACSGCSGTPCQQRQRLALQPAPDAVRGLRHRHHQPCPLGPATTPRLRHQDHERPRPWLTWMTRALAPSQARWYATGGKPPRAAQDPAACHVIQRERPQPFPGMSTRAPAGLRPAAGRSWPITGGSDDGLGRYAQDPIRALQGLVAAGRQQPGQPDLRHPRPSPGLSCTSCSPVWPATPGSIRAAASNRSANGHGSGGRPGRPTRTAAQPPWKQPRHGFASTSCPTSSTVSFARSPSPWSAAGRTS